MLQKLTRHFAKSRYKLLIIEPNYDEKSQPCES